MDKNQLPSGSSNPLMKHFRQPAIYYRLPSGGRFWNDDSLSLSATGELAVLPMTTRDEITLKTPDALMNGQGVVDVIQSCVPSITNAWDTPSVDLDATLIAIRIASYGQQMDYDANCPSCNEENSYAIDLSRALEGIQMPDYDTPVVVSGLKIKLKPQKYFDRNNVSMLNFEEQQLLKVLSQASEMNPNDLKTQFDAHLQRLVDINIGLLTTSTEYIELEDGTRVSDVDYLIEFYSNTDTRVIKAVQTRLAAIAEQADIPPQDVTCSNCGAKFGIGINFEYSSFFALGS